MKSDFGTLFLVFLIFEIFIPCQPQQQRRRRGTNVAGRNNMGYYADGQISKTQRIKVEERQKFHQLQQQVQKGTNYKDYMFDLQVAEEFILNIPVQQQIALSLHNYINMDGAYLQLTNIDNQKPINVQIYQNSSNLIHASTFYFESFIIFQGKQFSTYTIRFTNQGAYKMIAMSLKKLTQSNHIQKLTHKDLVQGHFLKASDLFNEFKVLFSNFERLSVINFQAVKILLKKISFYFYWHVIEAFMAILICVFQVFSIGKICKSEPIV